jgi:GNAT superfamily N-acetyltransferase
MKLREASSRDIPVMATHHRKMFEEIWEQKGEYLGTARSIEIENAYIEKLTTELASGICKAWVIEGDAIIASVGITFVSFAPNPTDLSSKVAYLHSMFTEKNHRNKKCAQQLLHGAIKHCEAQGIKRIILNASDAGKTLYQKIGFRSVPDMMRLWVESK